MVLANADWLRIKASAWSIGINNSKSQLRLFKNASVDL